MAKYTPGPWEHRPASNYVGYWIAPKGTLPTLAAVERPRGATETITVECFNFPGETEANARLIAAAPAYALAWSMVPDDVKGRILDALRETGSAWVEEAITAATQAED